MKPYLLMGLVLAAVSDVAWCQTASLGRRVDRRRHETGPADRSPSRERAQYKGNPLLEDRSLIAIPIIPPKQFQKHDIITIIVRNQKRFEADGDLESRKKFELTSELENFFKFLDGGIGAAVFSRGKPSIDYKFQSRIKNEGDTTREDTFTTRVSGEIIDIKPNGNLVIEAAGRIKHDEEVALVTVTGTIRSADVTPDNTVLSTQVADLNIEVKNQGAVRDAYSRGWLTAILDFLKPI